MRILYLCTLLFYTDSMVHAEPFSFKEIDGIARFTLVKPHYVKALDGIDLAYYPFVDSSCSKIVVLYAGAGLYGNKTYQWVAKTLYDNYHIGCYIFDVRGHGHSQGPRGDGPSIQQVIEDVECAVKFVQYQNLNAHIYLAGHSSGAGLLINYAASKHKKLEEGYIFIAPYLGPKSNTLYEHKDAASNFIKSVRTWLYIAGAMFPNSFFIHWTAVWFNYPPKILQADPLIVPSYSYVMSMATTPYEIDDLLKKIDTPVALYLGEKDEQFIPEAVMDYQKLIAAPVIVQLIQDAGHLSILLQAPQLIAQAISKMNVVVY